MFSQQMAVAVRLRGEKKRTVGTLERLLPGMRQHMAAKRRRPRELSMAVRTRDSVWCKAVGGLLLRWLSSSIRFRSGKKRNKVRSCFVCVDIF